MSPAAAGERAIVVEVASNDGYLLQHFVARGILGARRLAPRLGDAGGQHGRLLRRVDARDAGANEFLAKPFTAQLIYSRIQALIESHRPFIKCKVYFGPDRRRKKGPPPDGWERRGQDKDAAKDKSQAEQKKSEAEPAS